MAAEQALRSANDGDVTIKRDQAGRVHFVGTQPGHPAALPSGVARTAAPATAARAHLGKYAALFGIKDAAAELAPLRSAESGAVKTVTFGQRQGGISVLGGELTVSLDAAGNLVSINGEAGAIAASHTATVSATSAAATAKLAIAKGAKVSASELNTTKPTLWIYDPALLGAPGAPTVRPVWRMQVETTSGEYRRWTVLIDATDGAVALAFADLAHAKSRRVCDFRTDFITGPDDWACPSGTHPVTRTEGGPALPEPDDTNVNVAYDVTGAVYDYYFNVLGRDSINGAGSPLISSVRVCVDEPDGCPYPNAFWDGQQMVFGEGFVTDDVVAHELTHGVTQHESNLLYYFQSGAINESMSDVIGELFDLEYTGPGSGDDSAGARWWLGEDLPIGTIRDMQDPTVFQHPDRMSSTYWTSDPLDQAFDAGGVHTNSGVGNKAAYLMTDGDTFNGITVTGIGATKAAHVWYEANQLMTSGSDYADLYTIMQQACANLVTAGTAGITTADCAQVKNALDAVEMSQPANEPAIPLARRCAMGFTTISKFTDKFDREVSGSLGSTWTESTGVSLVDDFQPSATAGGAMFISGNEPTFVSAGRTRYAYTTAYRTLSTAYTTYLHFDHAYSLDWFPAGGTGHPVAYFDGARVEIDVSGDGKSWLVPSLSAWNNGPNHNLINDHPDYGDHPILAGARTFAGESRGWTASRLSLASYKGKMVKVRFRVALDGFPSASAGYGWWVDNVRLYRCAG
ncbi:MAG: M4 family metallopeptidase [Sporichthyaceae bacterium]|nr:M4 family metallopeptidase [Sporichthyaceae bacterium]